MEKLKPISEELKQAMWRQSQKRLLQEITASEEKGTLLTSIEVWYSTKTGREVVEFHDYDNHICNVVEQYIKENLI